MQDPQWEKFLEESEKARRDHRKLVDEIKDAGRRATLEQYAARKTALLMLQKAEDAERDYYENNIFGKGSFGLSLDEM